ncbi:polysaccharide deacetylase family protein [Streptomyces roseirectus]|uniref:Polysaccharide deacetylase family protein n=1 Tax=Streptomyces roseirectus TaxID=2768066 RepID=A0A7H0ILB2_9ACTN|nr:polysaccharide deacetylase family protein [Streptomyces roseirectus]QNP73578.1 polysaccharide deacetylase family protein [Streptomyces roseirectus]
MTDTRVPILMYHAIADQPSPATRELSVTPEAFAHQMDLIAARGRTPLTTAGLAAHWRTNRPLPPRPVLITFDDGYEGVHRHALPSLAGHGFPATLFVSTGWIKGAHDTGGALDTMLDWPQIRQLADADVEIGGHSHSHPQLDQLDDTSLRTELTRCRDLLADQLGAPPVSFAYPYGYSDRRVRAAVRESGFAQALAVGNALAHRAQGPYALRRVTVRRRTSAAEFARLLDGDSLTRTFAGDRALTKGYALVRGARKTARRAVGALS